MPFLALISIALASSFIQGVTGFGYGLLAAPLLSRVLNPIDFIATLSLISVALNAYLTLTLKQRLRPDIIIPLSVATLIGIPLGLIILQALPAPLLRQLVALSVIVLLFLDQTRLLKLKLNPQNHFIIGALVGLLQSSVGVNGPLLVLYLRRLNLKPIVLRQQLAIMFLIISLATILLMSFTQQITPTALTSSAIALPGILIGAQIGRRCSAHLKPKAFHHLLTFLILLTALVVFIT
jgi:uncharacterized protein